MWIDSQARRAGFTMVELGMAGLILALVMVPMIGLVQLGVRGTTESVHLTHAFQMARSAVDAVETLPYDQLDDASAAAVVTAVPVPLGVAAPQLRPIEIVNEPGRKGEVISAKVVVVRVPYDRVEGNNPAGEVVLKAMVVRAR